jgi:hypothetical protein
MSFNHTFYLKPVKKECDALFLLLPNLYRKKKRRRKGKKRIKSMTTELRWKGEKRSDQERGTGKNPNK